MSTEKSLEQLKRENEELKQLLEKVLKAYDILQDTLKEYIPISKSGETEATVGSVADVKKLLEKYSRL